MPKKASLAGSRQRRARFNPETSEFREEAVKALQWGTQAVRANREAVQKISKPALERGLSKLIKSGVKARQGKDGIELLLFRGEGRCELNQKFKERNSWSAQPRVASRFADDAKDRHEPCPHRTAAWVPASAIVSIPLMYGSESKAWAKEGEETKKGKFIYRTEQEVIVDPFKPSEHQDAPYDPVFYGAFRDFQTIVQTPEFKALPKVAAVRKARELARTVEQLANNEIDKATLDRMYAGVKLILAKKK